MRRSLPSLSLAAALALCGGPGCLSAEQAPGGGEGVLQLETSAFEPVAQALDAPPPTTSGVSNEKRPSEPTTQASPDAPTLDAAGARGSALQTVQDLRPPAPKASDLFGAAGDFDGLSGTGAVHARTTSSSGAGPSVSVRDLARVDSVGDKAREQRPMPIVRIEPPARKNADDAELGPSRGGSFVHAGTNPFVLTREDRHSTFAIDVDTASYTYARRFLERGQRPAAGSVRVEEWVNAFHYSYPQPKGPHPFAIDMEAAPSPLSEGKLLLRVGIQGKKVTDAKRDPVHLTFLVDTSGSMRAHDKLPLAKSALHLLVNQLRSDDSVALITYAGATREVLRQAYVNGDNKARIHRAIDELAAGGGTAMSSGMELAYQNANKHLGSGSTSRVIVLSDGDANIGKTSHQAILQSIKGYVSEGITLSTVGFGTGNYKDHLMEQLANAGNGNYSYIDSEKAARKVFVQDLTGTLQVIAQDVKIQVEMNPQVVRAYRLLGYENRDVADRDFRNDKVDAGEIGAGHSVTALYEVELVGNTVSGDLGTVRVRYKKPRGAKATEVAETFTAGHKKDRFGDLDRDTRFAAALSVAAEVLRGSPFAKDLTLEDAWSLAAEAADGPYAEERQELVKLLDRTVRSSSVAVR